MFRVKRKCEILRKTTIISEVRSIKANTSTEDITAYLCVKGCNGYYRVLVSSATCTSGTVTLLMLYVV